MTTPSAAELSGRIAADLTERLTRLDEAAARVRVAADDEAIHDLRVVTRRLDAALRLWRPFLGGARRRARRRLRRLRRALGPVRELEVDLVRVRALRPRLDPEPAVAAEHLLVGLARRLERGRGRAARAASAIRLAGVRRAIERALRTTERRVAEDPRPMERLGASIFADRERARAALAEAMRTGDDAPLHGARIAVKRLRYAIETLAPAGEAALARRARDLQHALGDVHDAALLRDRIGRRVRRLREHGAEAGAAALGPLIEMVEASRREALAAARDQAERLETRGHDRGLSVLPRTGADSA